jgi:hypothetical protein
MNKIKFAFFIIILLTSCKEKDHTSYYTFISVANRTDFEIKVNLYPKHEYLMGELLYKAGTLSGGYSMKNFSLNESDSMWYNKRDLYFADNINLKPTSLINAIFDSIKIFIQDPDSTIIKFTNTNSIPYALNPYQNDSIWEKHKELNSINDPKNNGFNYIYVFTIDRQYLAK